MSLISQKKKLNLWNSRLLPKEWHYWLCKIYWYGGNPSPSRLTVIEKALSIAVGGCQLTSWKQSVTMFPAKNFPVLSSVGVQYKTTMGKAGIKQGLYLVLGKPPVPSEIWEWQESLARDCLFASASEFPLTFPQYSRFQVFPHIKWPQLNTVCKSGAVTHFHT